LTNERTVVQLKKRELIDAVADSAGLEGKHAEAAIDALLDVIRDRLAAGEAVVLPGFGTFERRERSARTGRNPQTGESLEITAKSVPAFKAAAGLKRVVGGA
jgi:DNA-binding protein HU-beta